MGKEKVKAEKITASMVLEELEKYESITVRQIAERFGCSPDTIKNRLKILREDGEPLIYGPTGYIKVGKDWVIDNIENAKLLEGFISNLLGTMKHVQLSANPLKKLLPAMRKQLKENYSPEERKSLMNSCVKVVTLIAHVEAEDED